MDDDLLVATKFHRNPGGRYYTDGPWTGEQFREEVLKPALRAAVAQGAVLTVNFDGTSGMPTSFTEEAFGGLLRGEESFTPAQVRKHLRIVAPLTPRHWPYVKLALQYIEDEAHRQRA